MVEMNEQAFVLYEYPPSANPILKEGVVIMAMQMPGDDQETVTLPLWPEISNRLGLDWSAHWRRKSDTKRRVSITDVPTAGGIQKKIAAGRRHCHYDNTFLARVAPVAMDDN
jgi:hypothetical protein